MAWNLFQSPAGAPAAAAASSHVDEHVSGNAMASFWNGLCRRLMAACKAALPSPAPDPSAAERKQQRQRGGHRWLPASVKKPSWCDLCGGIMWGRCAATCVHCLDCKYTCHSKCQQHVTSDSCRQRASGADDSDRVLLAEKPALGDSVQDVDDTDSGYSGSGHGSLQKSAGSSSSVSSSTSWDKDLTCDGLARLDRDELCKRVQQYNSKFGFAHFMTLPNKDNVFQGRIQVCLSISRPVQMSQSMRPLSLHEALRGSQSNRPVSMDNHAKTTAVRLPKNAVVSLQVSSLDTVSSVIEMLLRKFKITDSPHGFTLYEQTVAMDADVKLRRMDRTERPLVNYLTWRTDADCQALTTTAASAASVLADVTIKRLVLQENNSDEIVWEAFSIPELLNFLRFLEREEKESSEQIKAKYRARKKMLELQLAKEKSTLQVTMPSTPAVTPAPSAVRSASASSAASARKHKKR